MSEGWPYGHPYSIPTGGFGNPRKEENRSKGLHLSQILSYICKTMGLWTPDTDKMDGFDLMGHLGVAWEDYLAVYLKAHLPGEFLYHDMELEMDGIYITPDGVQITEEGEVIPHEIKAKWKNARAGLEEFFYDLAQVKSQCRALGTRKAHLHWVFVAGYYKPPFPVYREYEIEFSERELEESWVQVVGAGKGMK